ncbi:unnamed protein product [Pieris macdunnoughi]|uniref:LITAF domain-containing protein n=1 Tax=Pieris macdunnoughi TaxID=345717 RepID=A0A821N9C5_9NEOP|nr:unnamed protein product [Pieris macdunnoughi]
MSTHQWNATAPSPPSYPEHIPPLGPKRCNIKCPFCNIQVITSISHTTTTRTHFFAFSSILCCCCVPYCMNSTRNTDHYCTSCHAFLGTYKK